MKDYTRRAIARNPTHVTVPQHQEAVRAMRYLLTEVNRMRDLAPVPQDLPALVTWMCLELEELEDEPEGSERAVDEAGDVLALAINIAILATGGRPALALEAAYHKLHRRLDEVERGATWAEAKERVG